MNDAQLKEFMRLDIQRAIADDEARRLYNDRWKLKNEILRISHEIKLREDKAVDIRKQQYRLMGRVWVDVKEEEKA